MNTVFTSCGLLGINRGSRPSRVKFRIVNILTPFQDMTVQIVQTMGIGGELSDRGREDVAVFCVNPLQRWNFRLERPIGNVTNLRNEFCPS